jgi:hypothetical protein
MISLRTFSFFIFAWSLGASAQVAESPEAPGTAVAPQEAPNKPRTAKAQAAVIHVEGATVYVDPDFDSKVIAVLPPGMKVVISQRKFPGRGGLGAFYRIRFNKKRLGYVADTEVITEFQKVGKKQKKNPVFEDVEEMREQAQKGLEPIYFTRYLGGQTGLLGFTEKINGQTLSDDVVMYGVRATGPGVLFDGPPLDFTVSFSPKPPGYYDDLGRTASGFFLFSDLAMLFGLWEQTDYQIYGGLGIMGTYTKFTVNTTLDSINKSEFRIGATADLGFAYRRKRWVGRADAKYYYEKQTYFGYWLSLQHEY